MSTVYNLKARPDDGPAGRIRKNRAAGSKPDAPPKEGTIEYLFKDYSGERFRTELTNPDIPAGKEKW
jgi:hypothetical protein